MSKYANDGRWRLGLFASVALAVFSLIAFAAYYFDAFTAILGIALQQPLSPANIFAASFDGGGWFLVIFASIAIGYAWPSTMRARQRMRQRELAFAGDRDALPLAKASPTIPDPDPVHEADPLAFDPTGVVDSSSWAPTGEQVHLRWRALAYTQQRWAPLMGCLGLLGALAAGGLAMAAAILLVFALQIRLTWLAFVLIIGIPAVVMFAVGRPLWRATMRLADAEPVPSGDENEVFADGSGLTWRRPGVPDVALMWTEARLLEVALTFPVKDTPAWRVYTLWSADGRSVSWPVYNVGVATPQHVPDEPARVELARASDALLRLIGERTGLTSRTFDAELMADPKQAQPWYATIMTDSASFNPLGRSIYYFFGGVLPLSSALAIALLPLTSVIWVNIYGALSMLIVGLVCLRTMSRWRRAERRPRNADNQATFALPAAPSAPSALEADALFTLAQRPTRAMTLAVWLLAPSCALDALVVVIAFIMPGSHYGDKTLGWSLLFTAISALILTAVGGGIGLVNGIANIGPRRIVAGPERLSQGLEGAADPKTSILWDKVTAVIAVTRRDGRVTGYRVVGKRPIGQSVISWRRDPRSVIAAPSPRPLLQRAMRVTPDELAALVVAKTGLTLEARNE